MPVHDPARRRLRDGDLIVVDSDAGPRLPDGERAGALFLGPALGGQHEGDGTYGDVLRLPGDPRWREPIDILLTGGHALLLDESGIPPAGSLAGDPPEARGVIWDVDLDSGASTVWWTDPRLRQPVGITQAHDGTIYVSDRAADPAGLGGDTGAVFVIPPRYAPGLPDAPSPLGADDVAAITSAQLVTPAALVTRHDGRILLMDADANPKHVFGTPGVLFEIRDGRLVPLLEPAETTSPLGLIETDDGILYLVDCNEGRESGVYADGALFRVDDDGLVKLIDSYSIGRPKALHDPALGTALPDGTLAVADANLDPLGLGEDGSKGFQGSGPGCVVRLDPQARTIEVLLASPAFVTPVSVRMLRTW
ncbi:MAG: hypothetical protein H6825_07675 [Planctomycetes bacterium]|nr:hypothetical protein [Planctomycetota bacterium]